ncbi:Isochorismatase-like protein [Niveomyces insectorum RCEF 264]|uniref:Isochorismatase-like protein n=1 Tax=Niveomyces insectorum RCEF 264 TaxID=1081102 RepID=A0A167XYG9_9HYPO|nr:Isochorismatase-like protein [Niveomyces insectorum RCEF 264]
MADARTALFVIDIQNDLARDPNTQIPHADRVVSAGREILPSARRAIANAEAKGARSPLTIVFVQHEEDDGPLLRGSEAWGLVFPPQPGAHEERLVAKTTRDTFDSNPNLAQKLRDDGVARIVAFGIQSECCVLSTCRGALEAGFQVTLLRGAHSTYDSDGKSAVEIEREVESELQAKGAQICSWEDASKLWE